MPDNTLTVAQAIKLTAALHQKQSVGFVTLQNGGTHWYDNYVNYAIANGLIALSGSVMCQQQRFFEIQMGTGAIVIGLASVIIGINLFRRLTFIKATTAVVLGSILYKGCVAAAISFGMSANDMKLVTAVLFLVILIAGNWMDRKGEPA